MPWGDAREGLVFDIDTFAVHDGPGIRMAVYLKGCLLQCKWCHSPESRKAEPELIFMRDRCTGCGTCAAVCERKVHRVEPSGHSLDRSACVACGRCVERCPQRALAIKGYAISAAAVVRKALHLRPFFDYSGGGITLTGGEVTSQVNFAASVLEGCRAVHIHTAIETSGACAWEQLARVAEHSDLVLYDLKLIEEADHLRWTGVSNQEILENAARLAGYHSRRRAADQTQVRVPLIPGITDREENLRGIFAFMRQVGLGSVVLLPYNGSASAKYEWLGLPYEIVGEPQSQEQLDRLLEMARAAGLQATIS
jgi:pyruvate formate lyase activating enzyme